MCLLLLLAVTAVLLQLFHSVLGWRRQVHPAGVFAGGQNRIPYTPFSPPSRTHLAYSKFDGRVVSK